MYKRGLLRELLEGRTTGGDAEATSDRATRAATQVGQKAKFRRGQRRTPGERLQRIQSKLRIRHGKEAQPKIEKGAATGLHKGLKDNVRAAPEGSEPFARTKAISRLAQHGATKAYRTGGSKASRRGKPSIKGKSDLETDIHSRHTKIDLATSKS